MNHSLLIGLVISLLAAGCEDSEPQNDVIEQPQNQEVSEALVEQFREQLRQDALNAIPRMEEMERGGNPIVRARVDTTGIFMLEIVSEGGEGGGIHTERARLLEDGSFVFFYISDGISVPNGALVDIRVGEYGYYFDAIVEE